MPDIIYRNDGDTILAILSTDNPDSFYLVDYAYPSFQFIDTGAPICTIYEMEWEHDMELVNQYMTPPVRSIHPGYVEHIAPDTYPRRHLHPGDEVFRIHHDAPHGNHPDRESFFWYYTHHVIPFEYRLSIPPHAILSRWLVDDHSTVMKGQPSLVISSDGHEFALDAPKGGTISIRKPRIDLPLLADLNILMDKDLLCVISEKRAESPSESTATHRP